LELIAQAFRDDGIYTQVTRLADENFASGIQMATQVLQHTFFRPNILFLPLRPETDLDELAETLDKSTNKTTVSG